jgi:hypothetical protein
MPVSIRISVTQPQSFELQREKLREEATKMLTIAAGNAGIQSPEAFQQWLLENRVFCGTHVFPRLLALLEHLIGDHWLFDRAPLQSADSLPTRAQDAILPRTLIVTPCARFPRQPLRATPLV